MASCSSSTASGLCGLSIGLSGCFIYAPEFLARKLGGIYELSGHGIDNPADLHVRVWGLGFSAHFITFNM